MSWVFSNPLVTLSDSEKNERDKALWEAEDLGGITEDNNRVPVPVVALVFLTVLTAFAITFPLWGQRPTAAIYVDYVKTLNSPEVQAIQDDAVAMQKIVDANKGSAQASQIERHPVSLDDLRILAPQIEALQKNGADLREYTVVGPQVVLSNYEGNKKADGTRERFQPWWDIGYTIDIFYLLAFFLGATIVIKRLPPSSWEPTHKHDH
ncbi:MAG: hypothetical protein HY849_11295 [Nitrosomonadales bacterium]|nr:hypothetical protein [Nitrosomonadales bacterium]